MTPNNIYVHVSVIIDEQSENISFDLSLTFIMKFQVFGKRK